MTQVEIIEYNRRCAEFLGMYDYSQDNEFFEKGIYYAYPEKTKNPGCGYYKILQITSTGYLGIFNSDWNWIMEVVEAISDKFGEEPLFKEVYQKWLYSDTDAQDFLIFKLSKKETVKALNQFLIWYNKSKI